MDITDFFGKERLHEAIEELRAMVRAGHDVPSLLRRIESRFEGYDCKLLSVYLFNQAFRSGIAAVKPVAGWSGFGRNLTDEQLNALVLPVLDAFRSTTSS